jgi:parvulin-like peptidyl-prolyl isomerase
MTESKTQNKTKFFPFATWIVLFICHLLFVIWNHSLAQDKIVAIVNNDIITEKDLNDFINFMRMELQVDYQGEELEQKIQGLREDLLDKLIEDRLILQEAKKEKLNIDQARVKARVDELRDRYLTDAEFQKALMLQGLTQSDIETKIRQQLLMYNIIESKVKSGISVKPSEITDFYHAHSLEFKSPEERQVRIIKVAQEDRAKAAYAELVSGATLDSLANKYSLQMSELSVRQNKELREDIENTVFSLNQGGFSAPLEVGDVFYIFQLKEIIPSHQLNLAEAQGDIYSYLFNQKMQEALAKWLASLRQRSYIKIKIGDSSS